MQAPPQQSIDTAVGTAMTAAGSAGITVQFVTQAANLTVLVLNIVLALGGLYLLYLRIRRAHREARARGGEGMAE